MTQSDHGPCMVGRTSASMTDPITRASILFLLAEFCNFPPEEHVEFVMIKIHNLCFMTCSWAVPNVMRNGTKLFRGGLGIWLSLPLH